MAKMIYCRLGEYGSFYNWGTLANHDDNEDVAKKKRNLIGRTIVQHVRF